MILMDAISFAVDNEDAVKVGGSGVMAFIGWAILKWVKSKRLQKALRLVQHAAAIGVSSAWSKYTEAIKASRADGKLTDEEKRRARSIALSAAMNSIGDAGVDFVQKVFKDDWDTTVKNALEQKYDAFRRERDAVAANTAPVGEVG